MRLHHPVTYTYMYMMCAYVLCMCVCRKTHLWKSGTFWKKKKSYDAMARCVAWWRFVEENCCRRLQFFHEMVAGWQRWVGSLEYHVSFAKESYKNGAHLKKRPSNLGSLQIIATIVLDGSIKMCIAVCCSVLQCAAVSCSVLQCAAVCLMCCSVW